LTWINLIFVAISKQFLVYQYLRYKCFCFTIQLHCLVLLFREVMLGEQKELEKAKNKKGAKSSKNKSKRFPDKPTADVSIGI